jgi:telomerase reverse transcriptase
MFKIQSHAMFFDTSINSLSTVLLNIYTAFMETATKMWSYARCLPVRKQPSMKLVISKHISFPNNRISTILTHPTVETIRDVIDLAFMLLRSKSRKKNSQGFKFAVSKMQVEWYAVPTLPLGIIAE